MVGIYKITSPSLRIYIGQSVNIENRLAIYKGMFCKKQAKLYASFLKYGFINHRFEVIEECLESELNDREEYYIKLFDSCDYLKGLNLQSGGRSKRQSEETKRKISKAHIGRKRPGLAIRNIQNRGKKLTLEQVAVIIKRNTGTKRSEETKKKISDKAKNRVFSDATKSRMSISAKKKVLSNDHVRKLKEWQNKGVLGTVKSKKVIDTSNGFTYPSITNLCNTLNLSYWKMKVKLRHPRLNDTTFNYVL